MEFGVACSSGVELASACGAVGADAACGSCSGMHGHMCYKVRAAITPFHRTCISCTNACATSQVWNWSWNR